MDDARFDALAKRLAAGVTRRGVLRGFASLTGAGLAALVGRSAAVATDCNSRCDRLPAGDARDQCQAACAAADQAQATAEATRVWAAALRACQGDESRLCGSGTDVVCCAPDETCQEDGSCKPAVGCVPLGGACTSGTDCCAPNVCADQACVAACPPGYRLCDGVCYPGGCCNDADCGAPCLVCGADHVCRSCEAVGQVCENGTCVPATTTTTAPPTTTTSTTTTSTTTTSTTSTTTTTTTTTKPPITCPAGSSVCQGSGDPRPTCCGAGSVCPDCTNLAECVCCPAEAGTCIHCLPGQYGCCTTDAANPNDNTCTCCAGDQTCCGGTCTDLATDTHNCGACGHVCGTGQVCCGGTCKVPEGGSGCHADADCCSELTCCRGTCVDIRSSERNCGACGHACAPSQVCCGGACGLALGSAGCHADADCCSGLTCCGGICKLPSGGSGCHTNADCCSHTENGSDACCGGTCCFRCEVCNDASNTCVGTPRDGCCGEPGGFCTFDADCCNMLICGNGACCGEPGGGARCIVDADCCGGTPCVDNMC